MQKDIVLRFPKLCSSCEIAECSDHTSNLKIMKEEGEHIIPTEGKLCSVSVPASCHRIQCFKESSESYESCRLAAFIQTQMNESGFWMKLPCSNCSEKTNLHDVTKGFVYNVGESGDS